MTVEEFIAARLDEDEEIARAAGDGNRARWGYDDDEVYMPDTRTVHDYGGRGPVQVEYEMVTRDSEGIVPSVDPPQAHHIARYDPARTRRQVARDRKVLARHTSVPPVPGYYLQGRGHGPTCAGCGWRGNGHGPVAWPCVEVRDLAAVWADHPDYQQEWSA